MHDSRRWTDKLNDTRQAVVHIQIMARKTLNKPISFQTCKNQWKIENNNSFSFSFFSLGIKNKLKLTEHEIKHTNTQNLHFFQQQWQGSAFEANMNGENQLIKFSRSSMNLKKTHI